MSLSKREKILLFILIMVAILYFSIQFLILPLATRYIDGLSERNHLAAQQARVEDDIRNEALIQAEHEDAQERLETIKREYPLLVPNEEIDTILTNLCLKNYLRPTSLSISIPPEPTPSEESEEEEDTRDPEDMLFTIVTATMHVTGTYEALANLIDEVDSMQYIRITNLGYTASRSDDDTSTSRVNIEFELTFVNP